MPKPERTIYNQRLYQTGPTESGWRRVRDWGAYLTGATESVGRSADKKVSPTWDELFMKDERRARRAPQSRFFGAPLHCEHTEPEDRDPIEERQARLDRLAALVAKHGPVIERERRNDMKVRPLRDDELLRAVRVNMKDGLSMQAAVRYVARRVPQDAITGEDSCDWIEQLSHLERCGLVETDGDRYWLTPEGHIALGMSTKRRHANNWK